MLWNIPFILASASPRRRELLHYLLKDYTVEEAGIREVLPLDCPIGEAIEDVACQKARAVAARHDEDCTVLGADTMVLLNNVPFGKPKDADDAFRMLSSLSGNTHTVITGVCVIHRGREYTFHEETKVTFGHVSPEEMRENIRSGEPMDKAGGYAIQGTGGTWIRSIEGCYTNVIGLPMEHLRELLLTLDGGNA